MDHLCAHRVELDVPIAREYIGRRIHEAGSKATLPQRACPAVAIVEVPHINTSEISHQLSTRRGLSGRKKQVDVIRHQAVRMHSALHSHRRLAELVQVNEIIAVYSKAGLPIVSALYDVESDARNGKSGRSSHSRITIFYTRG